MPYSAVPYGKIVFSGVIIGAQYSYLVDKMGQKSYFVSQVIPGVHQSLKITLFGAEKTYSLYWSAVWCTTTATMLSSATNSYFDLNKNVSTWPAHSDKLLGDMIVFSCTSLFDL